jgi:FdhE protein
MSGPIPICDPANPTAVPQLRQNTQDDSARHFDPVLRPDLAALYATRAARLRHLAEGHELAAYLEFAALVTEAQARCLEASPAPAPLAQLSAAEIARSSRWTARLDTIIAALGSRAPATVAPHLAALAAMADDARRSAGQALVEGRFEAVEAAFAPLLWAALSVEAACLSRAAPLPAPAAQESPDCPCCGTAPVASLIHSGARPGLRYLHCALCDCEWHMVRAKCSNCGASGEVDYLSFETAEAAIRAEACSACGGYLKVVSHERDPAAELVADDLASLLLDEASVSAGFARTGFNPFALPAGTRAAPDIEPDP